MPPVRLVALLALAFAGLALSPPARAFGDASRFTFALLRYDGDFNPRPTGLARLAWEVVKRTSVDAGLEPKIIDATDPDLFEYPFLVLAGDADFAPFSEAARQALRRYLTFGGFLLVDDASGQPGGPFDEAARRELSALLPGAKIARIGKDHVLYESFYLLDGPSGRLAAAGDADGVVLSGRLAVVFSPDDLLGATSRDAFGNWEQEVTPGGERQRELAFRFGINLVMYALCLDYKADQVHVPFIMRRRR